MKIKIKNKEDFLQLIMKDAKKILNNEGAKSIKQVESDTVKEVVYDKYTPSIYKRRSDNGGLSDINNMNHSINEYKNKLVINIKNNTPVNPEFYYQYHPHLDMIIEEGLTYPLWFENNPSKYSFLEPRNFLEITQRKINNGNINKDIISEFISKGWNIK